MSKGGIIIRLIDVAMIILFGFIAISDIKVRAQIKLPSDQEQEDDMNREEPVLLFVKIGAGGQVLLNDQARLLDEQVPIQNLEERILDLQQKYLSQSREIVVLIEPEQESIMQYTIDVLDICERNQIPKNINYKSMQF
jgi:biopolymer transport protein ExbD